MSLTPRIKQRDITAPTHQQGHKVPSKAKNTALCSIALYIADLEMRQCHEYAKLTFQGLMEHWNRLGDNTWQSLEGTKKVSRQGLFAEVK